MNAAQQTVARHFIEGRVRRGYMTDPRYGIHCRRCGHVRWSALWAFAAVRGQRPGVTL